GLGAGVVAAVTGELLAHLITAVTLSFLALSALLAVRSLSKLTVSRTVQPTAYDGDEVTIAFVVHNAGRRTRTLVEISAAFYSPFAASGRVSALVDEVPPGGEGSVSGTMRDL